MTITRVLLLGEAPNAATVGRPDLWLRPDLSGIAHAANRLRDYAGWSTSEFLRVFAHRDNVAERPPARWDAAAAAAAYAAYAAAAAAGKSAHARREPHRRCAAIVRRHFPVPSEVQP